MYTDTNNIFSIHYKRSSVSVSASTGIPYIWIQVDRSPTIRNVIRSFHGNVLLDLGLSSHASRLVAASENGGYRKLKKKNNKMNGGNNNK